MSQHRSKSQGSVTSSSRLSANWSQAEIHQALQQLTPAEQLLNVWDKVRQLCPGLSAATLLHEESIGQAHICPLGHRLICDPVCVLLINTDGQQIYSTAYERVNLLRYLAGKEQPIDPATGLKIQQPVVLLSNHEVYKSNFNWVNRVLERLEANDQQDSLSMKAQKSVNEATNDTGDSDFYPQLFSQLQELTVQSRWETLIEGWDEAGLSWEELYKRAQDQGFICPCSQELIANAVSFKGVEYDRESFLQAVTESGREALDIPKMTLSELRQALKPEPKLQARISQWLTDEEDILADLLRLNAQPCSPSAS